jgi:ketosteroid isomerase-like protein
LEAEGGRPGEKPTPAGPESRSLLPDAIWWVSGSAALADTGPAEPAIREVLDRYRQAMEDREIKTLAGLYAEFPAELQVAQERYFDNVRDLHVDIDNLDIAVVGDEAVVSYTRTDDFTDVRTGRPVHVSVRVTKVLRLVDGAWKLTAQ